MCNWMVRWSFFIIVILACLMVSCETEPVISVPSQPIPFMYAVLDDQDTTHKILICKSFGSGYDPAVEAKMYDSLFFQDLTLRVSYREPGRLGQWIDCPVRHIHTSEKDSGYFAYPMTEHYEFDLLIRYWKTVFADSVRIEVTIPGYPDVYAQIKILDSITISSPKFNQQRLYLIPESSIKIHWSNAETDEQPHPWSEIDIRFEFVEKLDSTLYRSQYVDIQNSQYFLSEHDLYRELDITYEEFIREVLQQLKVDDAVLETYLGKIRLHINGGDEHLLNYKKYLYGYSDYNSAWYTNISNGAGILTSATHMIKDSMYFEPETRDILIQDNRMKKYKLIKRPEDRGKD